MPAVRADGEGWFICRGGVWAQATRMRAGSDLTLEPEEDLKTRKGFYVAKLLQGLSEGSLGDSRIPSLGG